MAGARADDHKTSLVHLMLGTIMPYMEGLFGLQRSQPLLALENLSNYKEQLETWISLIQKKYLNIQPSLQGQNGQISLLGLLENQLEAINGMIENISDSNNPQLANLQRRQLKKSNRSVANRNELLQQLLSGINDIQALHAVLVSTDVVGLQPSSLEKTIRDFGREVSKIFRFFDAAGSGTSPFISAASSAVSSHRSADDSNNQKSDAMKNASLSCSEAAYSKTIELCLLIGPYLKAWNNEESVEGLKKELSTFDWELDDSPTMREISEESVKAIFESGLPDFDSDLQVYLLEIFKQLINRIADSKSATECVLSHAEGWKKPNLSLSGNSASSSDEQGPEKRSEYRR